MSITSRRWRTGFTLIELMTVVAIIAIVVSILLPTVFAVMNSVRRVKCAANLNALGKAFTDYAANYNGWLPDRRMDQPMDLMVPPMAGTAPTRPWDWVYRRQLSPDVFFCPAVTHYLTDADGSVNEASFDDYVRATWVSNNSSQYARIRMDYEILIGVTSYETDPDRRWLGNPYNVLLWDETKTPACNWSKRDNTPDYAMVAADCMWYESVPGGANDIKNSRDRGWRANHVNRWSREVLGRNILYGNYSVQWVPFSRCLEKVNPTDQDQAEAAKDCLDYPYFIIGTEANPSHRHFLDIVTLKAGNP